MSLAFAYGFRVFFLSAAAYAVLIVAGWLGVLIFGWPLAGRLPMAWHAHEMIYGVVAAAIAGFLLTAVPNWTGTGRIHGSTLFALWLLWLAGRAGYWLADPAAGGPAAGLAMVLDLAFLPALAIAVAVPIVRSGNRRNLIMIALLSALFATNLWHHSLDLTRPADALALDMITLLMIVIGGRITPAFTRNWMMHNGMDASRVVSTRWLELASIALVVVLATTAAAGAPGPWLAVLAIGAGLCNLARLAQWQGWRTLRDPLVWVLHLGYAWIGIALLLRGIGAALPSVPDAAWLHAIGIGAMGTLILGVMARVSLGHTGRPLALPRSASAIFALITLAAVARVGTAAAWLPRSPALEIAAAAWIAAFVHFLFLYVPILLAPRADGKPG